MKKYTFIPQEDSYYCLPACLQMVLDRNGLEFDSQKKIFKECGINIGKRNTIHNFFRLKQYPLHCIDLKVSLSLCRDFEELIKESLNLDCDILVGFGYERLYRSRNEANHISILKDYNRKTKPNTTLIDPYVSPDGIVYCDFNELINSMLKVDDGFHIIHPDIRMIERLAKKYI